MDLNILVLAGGLASKDLSVLIPEGYNKVLLKIAGKPILCHVLQSLRKISKARINLLYRRGEESVYREASRCVDEGLEPVVQESGYTVGEAIVSASSSLEDSDKFMLVFGDLILDTRDLSQVISTSLTEEYDAIVLAVPLDPRKASTHGLVVIDELGFVKKVYSSPPTGVVENAYIAGGVYVLPTRILDFLEKGMDLPQALDALVTKSRVKAVNAEGEWVDVGSAKDLLRATYIVLSRMHGLFIHEKATIEKTVVIKEPPIYVDEDAYIDHYAVIRGPVYIGKKSFIGVHSFIRDYSNVEDNVRIGAFSELKFSNIQSYVYIHSRVLLMDSVVGENTIIESNVTALNIPIEEEELPKTKSVMIKKPRIKVEKMGAVIGHDSKIGAGVLLKPGEIIREKSIVTKT